MAPAVQAGWRRPAAELVGTFFLVLVAAGAGAAAAATGGKVGPAAQAVAPGVMVLALIYTLGETSGAHLNPAVTVAFAARGHFPWSRVPGYVAAQTVGAVTAAALVRVLFGTAGGAGASRLAPGTSPGAAFLLELLLTLGLMTVILGTSSGAHNVGHNAAIAIGGYIALAGLWAGPVSGASMNPARSLGPALVGGHGGPLWVYIAGPVLGAVLAVPLAWILRGPPSRAATRSAQGVDEERVPAQGGDQERVHGPRRGSGHHGHHGGPTADRNSGRARPVPD